MIRINLLPPEVEVSSSTAQFNPGFVVAGVAGVLVLILVPVSWVQRVHRNHLDSEISDIQSQLDRYKPIIAQVDALEQAKAQLTTRKSLIQQLENERLRYPYFMEDFLKLLPNNIWLTNLTTTILPDGSSLNVTLDITALDHYAVADLVSNLETSQIFTDVDLGTIQLSQTGTGQSITCHITTTYHKAAVSSMATDNGPKKS